MRRLGLFAGLVVLVACGESVAPCVVYDPVGTLVIRHYAARYPTGQCFDTVFFFRNWCEHGDSLLHWTTNHGC